MRSAELRYRSQIHAGTAPESSGADPVPHLAMAAVDAAAVEATAMEAAMEAATVEAIVPAPAEAETDHRSAEIGGPISAIVRVVIGAIGIAHRSGRVSQPCTHANEDAGRSRRS